MRPAISGRYPPEKKTGKRVAVIGSGPAGMAAAQQLGRAGHDVHVYERESRPGGLMRYGIPDFKMEKHYIDRRVEQMQGEGVTFHCGVNVGVDKPVAELLAEHDAVLYCGGSETPRAAGIPGDDLGGVHDAMPYLVQQNRRVGGEPIQSVAWPSHPIIAGGQHVVVVGGGDTASDCVGTAFRQGAVRVTQLDIRPQPPEKEDKLAVWPYWATKMRTSSSQAEGAEREFQVATLEFIGEEGQLTGVQVLRGRREAPADRRHRIRHPRRSRLHRHRLCRPGRRPAWSTELDGQMKIATDSRRSRNVDGQRPRLPDQRRQALCRRRRAPRPVAGRLGDPRGPPGGALDRRGADGVERPAALRRSNLDSARRRRRRHLGLPRNAGSLTIAR